MSGNVPFDPHEEAPLLSAYVDGELDQRDIARVEAYLETDPEARREIQELRRLKQLTGAMRLKEAPPEEWEVFWRNVYNRTERSMGWILFLLGSTILGAWGVWLLADTFLKTDLFPIWVKVAIILAMAGVFVLLVSVIRERIFKRERTRYKDVIR